MTESAAASANAPGTAVVAITAAIMAMGFSMIHLEMQPDDTRMLPRRPIRALTCINRQARPPGSATGSIDCIS